MSTPELHLVRIFDNGEATYGCLVHEGRPRWLTVELPWRNNERKVSCIPPGDYPCMRYKSYQHGDTYLVTEVPGRSLIMFHPGNSSVDTKGCILPGMEFSRVGESWGIARSRKAHLELMLAFKDIPEFTLRVIAPALGGMIIPSMPERH